MDTEKQIWYVKTSNLCFYVFLSFSKFVILFGIFSTSCRADVMSSWESLGFKVYEPNKYDFSCALVGLHPYLLFSIHVD